MALPLNLFPAGAIVLVLGLAATPASAGTIEVTTTADQHGQAGGCALREAIVAANTDADFGGCDDSGGDDVVRLRAERYVLTREGSEEDAAETGDLDITEGLEVRGMGPGGTTIDGNGVRLGDRAFHILDPATVEIAGLTVRDARSSQFSGGGILSEGQALTIRNCAIRDNRSPGGGGGLTGRNMVTIKRSVIEGNRATKNTAGGGISHSSGILRVTDSVVRGNKAELDAGIYTNSGDLIIGRSVVRDNEAVRDGGGIAQLAGSLTASFTRIEGNRAGDTGGGVYGLATNITLIKSEVSGNRAAQGGGIGTEGGTDLGLERVTVSANRVTGDGGGLGLYSSDPSDLVNTTVSGNTARGDGGGIYVSHADAEATLNNATVAANVADSDLAGGGSGGGIFRANGLASLRNSLLGDNVARGPSAENDCDGGIVAVYSLVEDDCPGFGMNNVTGLDPMLRDLADNGGQTKTHALRASSPALEIGDPDAPGTTAFDCLTSDQRGEPRPGGPRCDAGAYERQP